MTGSNTECVHCDEKQQITFKAVSHSCHHLVSQQDKYLVLSTDVSREVFRNVIVTVDSTSYIFWCILQQCMSTS